MGIIRTLAVLAVTSAWHMAQAQTSATPAVTTSQSSTGLEEIVVTATRREQNLQDVPIAVTAFSANSLSIMGITTTEDLEMATPGLSMTQQIGSSSPYIRGVGTANASTPGLESPVAMYVDGVYYPQNDGNVFAFNNVQSVEVDKGPQGTLFGRNSTGGAIVVTTLDPQFTPMVKGSLDYQNHQTVEGSLYATGPLSNDVAADIALYGIHQNEGFGRDLTTGNTVDYQRSISARAKILWTPTESDRFVFAVDGMHNPSDIGTVVAAVPGELLLNGQSHIGGPNDTTQGDGPASRTDTWTASIKYVHSFAWGSLSSLTAYHSEQTDYIWNTDATILNVLPDNTHDFSHSFQQEILVNSRLMDDKLHLTTGVFIYSANQGIDTTNVGSFISVINSNTTGQETTQSYAAFSEGTYAITNDTNITLGTRYTVDERSYYTVTTQLPGNTDPGSAFDDTGSKTFSNPSWRAVVDHKFTDTIMTYVRFDRGYKSGLFNLSSPGQPPVEPEKLNAYEVGLKSEFLDRQIRVNLAAYYYDYTNIQLGSANELGQNELLNAASAHIKGGELETVFAPPLPFGHLEFTISPAYLNAKYENFPGGPVLTPTGVGGNIETYGNLAGDTMIHAPKYTLSASASYSIPVGNDELAASANYYHNSGFYWQPDDSLEQPAYHLINGEMSYAFGTDQRYRVRVFGKNLTNTHYALWAIATTLGDIEGEANPRTYGVGFDFKL